MFLKFRLDRSMFYIPHQTGAHISRLSSSCAFRHAQCRWWTIQAYRKPFWLIFFLENRENDFDERFINRIEISLSVPPDNEPSFMCFDKRKTNTKKKDRPAAMISILWQKIPAMSCKFSFYSSLGPSAAYPWGRCYGRWNQVKEEYMIMIRMMWW